MDGRVHIGTSGWSYAHWIGSFYPEGTRTDAMLPFYAGRFGTVEINSTFYRLPESAERWRLCVAPDFVFAVKASRYITHMKKLRDPADSTRAFFECIEPLRPQLGPVLFQLPPCWRFNEPRLAEFLASLPGAHRYAFELRDRSWLDERAYRLLEEHNAACCIYDLEGFLSPEIATSDFVYVRLHGPGAAYTGSYAGNALAAWSRRIDAWRAAGRDVYCYFDNDEAGYAAGNALALDAMLR
jgi:uncharacterized protein YecE (DUF72 family)